MELKRLREKALREKALREWVKGKGETRDRSDHDTR